MIDINGVIIRRYSTVMREAMQWTTPTNDVAYRIWHHNKLYEWRWPAGGLGGIGSEMRATPAARQRVWL